MATIRRVTIHRLRNVKPGCTFELHSGLNVLLGQNGTGKTTLLQWMADFLSGNVEPWAREPYKVAVEIEGIVKQESARIEMTIENEISELTSDQQAWRKLASMAVLSQQPAHASLLTIKLIAEVGDEHYEISHRPQHLTFKVNGQMVGKMDEVPFIPGPLAMTMGFIFGAAMTLLEKASSQGEPAHQAALRGRNDNFSSIVGEFASIYWPLDRFDESLKFFDRLIEGREAQARLVISPSELDDSFSQLIPDGLIELASEKMHEAADDVQMLTFTADEVKGFLATSVRLFQYRAAALHLALLEKDMSGDEATLTYGNLRFTFHRHDGSIIGHDALSYGQKRMLSFLYYLALNPRLIIVDELVNGLHHAWIEACIEEIGDRQGLLTSQNPLLLDYLTFDSADEVRQRFILCRSERENGREQLIWRNPTQEEAESFFRAYQAGIQHVGEILVDKGLW